MAAPLAVLAAQVAGPRLLAAAAVVMLSVTGAQTFAHDTEGPRYRAFVEGLRVVAGDDRCVLLYCEDPVPGPDEHVDELAALRVLDDPTESKNIGALMAEIEVSGPVQIAGMTRALPALYPGARLLMGAATRQTLGSRYPKGPALLAALEEVFEFELRQADGFVGFELTPR